MANVTLLGEKQAKKDNEFIYIGPLSECRDCKIKTACFNLKPGRAYKVVGVRDKHHDCKIHEGGVRVVEIDELPQELLIEKDKAHEGAIIVIDGAQCSDSRYDGYLGGVRNFKEGDRFKVISIEEDVTCSDGRVMKRVLVEEAKAEK